MGHEWRPLNELERELLEALLSQNFQGAEALRLQLEVTRARQGCECGCGTIDLAVDEDRVLPAEIKRQPVPGEAEVFGDDGAVAGGLILFARSGFLSSLEIYSHLVEPAPLPALDKIQPYVISG